MKSETENWLYRQAQEQARAFLERDGQYRMGYVDAEQPHPLTRRLSQSYAENTQNGVRLLFEVDRQMAGRAAAFLAGQDYADFADAIRNTLSRGGRVIFSGCGSTGRLCMRLEQSWRTALEALARRYPETRQASDAKREAIGYIMTGGDYAVIRAVESFEDSLLLGKEQAKELSLCPKDLLVGITATGETTSILGTAMQALEDGASVYMLICSDPKPLVEKTDRAKAVYLHPACRSVVLPCGPMALTGSTRMQSSSFEQLAAAVALEGALHDVLLRQGVPTEFAGYGFYGAAFAELVQMLCSQPCVAAIAAATEKERSIYEKGGLVTLFADASLLDVLTDTTERAPTFMTPPFRSLDMKEGEESWAFVKNPECDTPTAWERCFARAPRCIEWPKEKYLRLDLEPDKIRKIPDISARALMRFPIGRERMPARENAPDSYALWVDQNPPPSFEVCARGYRARGTLTPQVCGVVPPKSSMRIFEHLCIKLMLNTLSTGVMAKMGKIDGNWMTCLDISNKKLLDRCARIVSDLCGVSYERALEEVFYSRAILRENNLRRSAAKETIDRLGIKDA